MIHEEMDMDDIAMGIIMDDSSDEEEDGLLF
jgi:hypothetical protein